MPADPGRAPALRTRLLAAMLAPMLAIAILLGVAGAALIADVVRRTNDRVLGGALGAIATIIGAHKANILGLRLDNRDTTFHTNTIDLEVRDATHLMRLLAALRAADVVNAAQRIDGSTQSN